MPAEMMAMRPLSLHGDSLSPAPGAAVPPVEHARQGAYPYESFWQAGFEGADHVNGSGTALCMNGSSGHLGHARRDYSAVRALGLLTVRESACWRRIERLGVGYDFCEVGLRALAARDEGVQLLWTFMHFGFPTGLDVFSDSFIDRFSRYCGELAAYLKPFHARGLPPVYTLINEISFLCWGICETGLFHPHIGDRRDAGYALKMRLVRATIAGCDAIRVVDPRARFLAVDPLVHVAPADPSNLTQASMEREYQFQAWDMLSGRLEPQLGGGPAYLDLVGVNYYPGNQWEYESRASLQWPRDPRRRRLSDLLVEVHERYGRPITMSETSHVGDERACWLEDVTTEMAIARARGVELQGACLYPAIDRPDWEQPDQWHRSGLWHVEPQTLDRTLNHDYARALRRARARLHA